MSPDTQENVMVGALLAKGTARLAAAGSDSARLDAELLLGHVLGVARTTVLAHPEARTSVGQAAGFQLAIARRETGEPVAYIRGLKEFFGLGFRVDHRALIPRPETERLVELAVDRLRDALTASPRITSGPPLRIWDVGTGCGAVAVAIAVTLRAEGHGQDVAIVASDRSSVALALAQENIVAHAVADMVEPRLGDLLDLSGVATPVDMVVANLPYVPSRDIAALPVAASFEPRTALDGGADGLDLVRRFLAGLPEVVGEGGMALLEIGSDQADAATAAADDLLSGWTASVFPDLSGQPRVLEVRRP